MLEGRRDEIPFAHDRKLVLLCQQEQFNIEEFSSDHASLRQAYRREALRHIFRAWRKPQDTLTGTRL